MKVFGRVALLGLVASCLQGCGIRGAPVPYVEAYPPQSPVADDKAPETAAPAQESKTNTKQKKPK